MVRYAIRSPVSFRSGRSPTEWPRFSETSVIEKLNDWAYGLGQTLSGQLDRGSIAAIFVVFAAGVITSLTPCVYPMYPVTVSFIGGSAGGNRRRAVLLSTVYVLALAS